MDFGAPAHLVFEKLEELARRDHRIDTLMRLRRMGGAAVNVDEPAHAALAGAHHAQFRRLAGDAHVVALTALDMMGDAGEAEFLIGGGKESNIARRRIARQIAHRQHEGHEAGLVVDGAPAIEPAIRKAGREGCRSSPSPGRYRDGLPRSCSGAPRVPLMRAITLGRSGATRSISTVEPCALSANRQRRRRAAPR